MSIWDDLIKLGADFASDPEAIRGVIDASLDLFDDEPSLARAGLKFAKAHADAIAHIAPSALIGLTGKFLSHGEASALEDYLRHHATSDEILETQEAAHRATAEEAASRSTWITHVLPVIKALAPALPYLLAVL